ncbi:MFS transporter [Actinoplanes aureus]|uniref:MFS transporter n=1 Tax=Actinoplanes aureus TaxID=2792083 RepID=UPI001E6045D7|nr:MFS transporter [Actinoplanes aureus]
MRSRLGSAPAVLSLIALSLSTFMYVTAETLPIGVLPLIAADLGRTVSEVGLLVTVYGLVVVVASVPLTKITQRVPRKPLLCALLVVFAVSNALCAFLDGYWPLMAARVVTALSQAIFWAVISPAAAALFRARVRPQALSILYAGSSVGALAGVPAGTWLGQQTSWRVAFLALSGVGLLILATLVVLMPSAPPGERETAHGSAPDAGRYWAIVVYTALAVGGSFTMFTYVSPFLTDVSGFAESGVGPLLFVRGLAGLIGVFVAGWVVGRNGWLTMAGFIGLQVLALTGQWAFGTSRTARRADPGALRLRAGRDGRRTRRPGPRNRAEQLRHGLRRHLHRLQHRHHRRRPARQRPDPRRRGTQHRPGRCRPDARRLRRGPARTGSIQPPPFQGTRRRTPRIRSPGATLIIPAPIDVRPSGEACALQKISAASGMRPSASRATSSSSSASRSAGAVRS